MKIIDGKDVIMGRLASYVAKESLKGEEIAVVNCEQIIISGNKKDIEKKFHEKRTKVGSGQRGPKHSRTNEKVVKRIIRGMIPNHRRGRGKEALQRIKCYVGVPKEFVDVKKITTGKNNPLKYLRIGEIQKWIK